MQIPDWAPLKSPQGLAPESPDFALRTKILSVTQLDFKASPPECFQNREKKSGEIILKNNYFVNLHVQFCYIKFQNSHLLGKVQLVFAFPFSARGHLRAHLCTLSSCTWLREDLENSVTLWQMAFHGQGKRGSTQKYASTFAQ